MDYINAYTSEVYIKPQSKKVILAANIPNLLE